MQAAEEPAISDAQARPGAETPIGRQVMAYWVEALLHATERKARPVTRRLEKVVARRQRHDFPSRSCNDKSSIATLLGGCRFTVKNKHSPGWWLVLVEITMREVALVITPGAVAGLLGR